MFCCSLCLFSSGCDFRPDLECGPANTGSSLFYEALRNILSVSALSKNRPARAALTQPANQSRASDGEAAAVVLLKRPTKNCLKIFKKKLDANLAGL